MRGPHSPAAASMPGRSGTRSSRSSEKNQRARVFARVEDIVTSRSFYLANAGDTMRSDILLIQVLRS